MEGMIMILSEKILNLRKKSGWSQEELAEKMNVSRQSISKWESATSIPDLNKIIEMSKLFGVSIDYLVKDDIEKAEYIESAEPSAFRKLSVQTARDYIDSTEKYAKQIALGTMMCILSPVLLVFLAGANDSGLWGITEAAAAGIGVVVLLCIVAAAVAIFIISSARMEKYNFIKKCEFETEYGVDGIVGEMSGKFSEKFTTNIVIGVVMCILGVCPLIIGGVLNMSSMAIIGFVVLLLVLVSIAVYLFINVEMMKSCFDNLMLEGEFTPQKIESNKKLERFSGAYWPAIVALYLLWSFLSGRWDITWLIWPVAALLFACLSAAFKRD